MTELTTSAIFLVASLYGSGQATSPMQTVQASTIKTSVEQTTNIESTSIAKNSAQTTSADTRAMEAYLRKQFGDQDAILVDIARCESNLHQFDSSGNIIRGVVNSADIGVMQINERYHDETAAKLGLDLHTVEGNVAYAKHLYEEQGTAPWKSSQKCWGTGDIAKK